MNEDQITKDYYANKNTTKFYLDLWGGDSIHIGIYLDDYKYNSLTNKEVKKEAIKDAIDRKKEYMYKFIKLYMSNYIGKYFIADFGSGYGGTSRYIYDKLNIFMKNNFSIDCYDISHDNCIINTHKNILYNYDIPVYNISFLEIPFSKKYNIIFSEDAFIHINNRNELFKQINKKLLNDGILIFSDIILTDNCNYDEIQEVYKRVNIKCLETHDSYVEKAKTNNLIYVNSYEYKESMLYHYKNIRDIIDENEDNKNIIEGLDNWIKHIELGNLTSKLFIFKKV
jgi:sarcosine/dimethylglycine N-methyltransferase